MLTYRKTTKEEDTQWSLQCVITKLNSMRCDRRVTRIVNNKDAYCEGHFAPLLQIAVQNEEAILDQDSGGELLTGKSEPTEK